MFARCVGGFLFVLLAADAVGRAPQLPGRPAKGGPVTGICLDEDNQPLAGVKVVLYRNDERAKKPESLGERVTGADGKFEFTDPPPPADDYGLAVAVTKAGRGSIVQLLWESLIAKPLEFRLRPADTLKGRVTDEAGKPVAGAVVWTKGIGSRPIDGIGTAVTDADGKYAIHDMGRWTDEDARPRPIGNRPGVMVGETRAYFDVRHPDFAHERPTWNRIPATVDVVLHPGGVVTGRVTDQVTGQPAAGVRLFLQGIKRLDSYGQARTDADGKYEIRCLKAGQYNLVADVKDRACAAIDSLTVAAGKPLTGQDLTLVEGGWIEGRVLDAVTGAPIGGTPERPLYVGCYGPGRPKSGAAIQSAMVDENGGFKLRVAPGTNYPYITAPALWSRTDGKADIEAGVEVKAGATTTVTFRVNPPG
jgi:5-hydroxyisourate hydrolase-like protein (transthyretin family)